MLRMEDAVKTLLNRLMPLRWLQGYRKADIPHDVKAGVTTAVMIIPQAMAYATIAGLPPIFGLYVSTLPLVVYALWGSSKRLAVGPVATDSLIVAQVLGALHLTQENYILHAAVLALMVGGIQILLGVLRMGFVVNFLSVPVVTGFTSAIALVIAATQIPAMLGVKIPRGSSFVDTFQHLVTQVGSIQYVTLAIGLIAWALLVGLKRYNANFPRALVVLILGTFATTVFTLPIEVIGTVPEGLPGFRLPAVAEVHLEQLIQGALILVSIGFMEVYSIGLTLTEPGESKVRANRELFSIGAANVAGSLLGGYPIASSFSRSAINKQAGARSQMAGIVTACVVVLTLLLLTPLFHNLPVVVLAALILSAVFRMVKIPLMLRLWRLKRTDGIVSFVTFFVTLLVNITGGLVLGVLLSLFIYVLKTTRPHYAILGRLPGTDIYRNIKRFPEAETNEAILVIRIDAQFYFGNVAFLEERLEEMLDEREGASRPKHLVMDMSGVNQIDASAATALEELHKKYSDHGIEIHLCATKGPVRDVLAKVSERYAHLRNTNRDLIETIQAIDPK